MTIELWFEFASTYSYPAVMRAERLAETTGIPLVWRPFLLGPIFQAQGWSNSPFNIYPAKGRYMWRDLERICEAQGLLFRRPSVFPRPSLLAARVACQHAEAPWLAAFVREVYEANFVRDEPIGESSCVSALLERVGQAPGPILEAAQAPAAKELLRQQTERATRLGIFGAPTFVVGDELFWGHDRMDSAFEWHAGSKAYLRP